VNNPGVAISQGRRNLLFIFINSLSNTSIIPPPIRDGKKGVYAHVWRHTKKEEKERRREEEEDRRSPLCPDPSSFALFCL
jgi:hypothetical protein